jgi:hypothetical protein
MPVVAEDPAVDVILLDWTRMGRIYCLAGAITQAGQIRIVRPMPGRARNSPIANNGWSPFLMDGHSRWEIFEMIHPVPAGATAPHLEDVWVHSLRPRKRLASPEQRRLILQATLAPPEKPLFGVELLRSLGGASYLDPGTGERSLTTIRVPSAEVQFTALWRDGASEPDYRVRLSLPGHDAGILPMKDHFLLCRAEQQSDNLDARLAFLASAVRQMGEHVYVRLGLSRSFPSASGQPGRCWLMADGFFSCDDPQS